MPTCKATKKDGTACQVNVTSGVEYCYFHSPRKKRTKTQKVVSLEAIDTSSIGGVAEFLSKLMIAVWRGEVEVKQSNTLIYCASNLARILEASELERRVAELEKQTHESTGKAGF